MTLTGKTVSHYEILSKIGAGGMASVYLANDLKHGRQVAIKVMNSDIGASIGTTRFLREIETRVRFNDNCALAVCECRLLKTDK